MAESGKAPGCYLEVWSKGHRGFESSSIRQVMKDSDLFYYIDPADGVDCKITVLTRRQAIDNMKEVAWKEKGHKYPNDREAFLDALALHWLTPVGPGGIIRIQVGWPSQVRLRS